ncbi:ubiquinol-cytochrome C chaperone family protein [Agrobacterium sp. ES01]|uniref:ubiquinol-cytochrome C chaperone family protein n=1 Tax=Agrobacterium sp. ES01 TaxID=3420714 RepID=UPI003D1336D2
MQQRAGYGMLLPRPILGKTILFKLFRQRKHNQIIVDRQYAALTSLARTPYFYTDLDVPDTVMGRFEMLTLVLILFFRRTAKSERSGQELAQEIIDAFFTDIDHSIRELGVGDQSVPKRMKKFAGMFYGRLESYSAAIDADEREQLALALRRNIYPDAGAGAPTMEKLAAWTIGAEKALTAITEDEVASGHLVILAPGGDTA